VAQRPSKRVSKATKRVSRTRAEPPGPAFGAAPPAQKKTESLGEYAYRVMRDAIRAGKLQPGHHVREAEVADWLMISRTPVREAFHRIVSEGLLTIGPWNGVMVSELDVEQLVQLYSVREVLEGAAAASAARHAERAEVDRMFEIAMVEAAQGKHPAKLVAINGELHAAIYRAAHNPYLLQSLQSIVDALGLLRHSTFILPGSIELAHREHMDILGAIRDGKAAAAERHAREHVRNALKMRLQLLTVGAGNGTTGRSG
jgi:DNA-binding GntR family transcriptional regulator